MSGESASIVEVCAAVGAGTLVAARTAAGAVLGAPGAGLSAAGRSMEQSYVQHRDRQAALAEWEAAAREVVDRNARLSVFAARPGGVPGLPPPLILQGQSRERLTAWCAMADQALDGVERALQAEAASAVSVVLASATSGAVGAAGPLAVHQQASAAPSPELIAACSRVLGGLSAELSPTDRSEVLAAVTRVRDCATPAEQQGWLAELRVRVREANAIAAQCRDQARTAAIMLQALAESTEPATTRLRGELDRVVAGRRALDPDLHRSALAACEQVRVQREDSYVRDSLTRALDKLGYQVEPGFDTFIGQRNRLRLVRDHWPEHAVSVLVDGGQVRAMVVRTTGADGDDAQRLDAEREQQWCGDFERLRGQLAGDGLRVDIQRIVPPGARHVPVAAHRDRPAEQRKHQRESGR